MTLGMVDDPNDDFKMRTAPAAPEANPNVLVGEGRKLDAGKTPLDLLPFESLLAVGEVLEFGKKKYAAHNWRGGMAWSRLLGACLRHLFAWARGQDADPETGHSHLAHAACCVLFLLSYTITKSGTDDRYKDPRADRPTYSAP